MNYNYPVVRLLWFFEVHFNLKYRIVFLVPFFLLPCLLLKLSGQTVRTYNRPGVMCYSELIFEDKAKDPKGVIVLDVGTKDIKAYATQNPYLDSGLFSDYNFLYINVLEKANALPLKCYEQIIDVNATINHIEASSYYFIDEITSDSDSLLANETERDYKFRIVIRHKAALADIKKHIDDAAASSVYAKPKVYTTAELDYCKMANYKNNLDVGINYSPVFLTGSKLGLNQTTIGLLGLSIKKHISQNNALLLNIGYSMTKKMKIQSELQSGTKDTLNSHALFTGEVLFRRYFSTTKPLHYYASLGLGMYWVNDVDLKRRKTSLWRDDQVNKYFVPVVDFGMEYRISPVLKVYTALPLRYFIGQSSGSNNTLGIGMNFGLSFTLNPGRISIPPTKEAEPLR